jgi:AMP deaminase
MSEGLEDPSTLLSRLVTKGKMSFKGVKKQAQNETYHRVAIDGDEANQDYTKCCVAVANAILMREQFKSRDKGQNEELTLDQSELFASDNDSAGDQAQEPEGIKIKMINGIFTFSGMKTELVPWKQYIGNVKKIYELIENGPCLSAARSRLVMLGEKFELYRLLNSDLEEQVDKLRRGGGVFANCTKVDNAVRLQTCIPAQDLVSFISRAAVEQPRVAVGMNEDGTPISLGDYIRSFGVADPSEITVEGLGLLPPLYRNKFLQYDAFEPEINPAGNFSADLLREVLSPDGVSKGNFFAQIVRPCFEKGEFAGNHIVASERQLYVLGKDDKELFRLARWVQQQGFNTFTRNMWVLTIPRKESLRMECDCKTFADQLLHIFEPLFRATLEPMKPDYADIAHMLRKTSGFCIACEPAVRNQQFFVEPMHPQNMPFTSTIEDNYFLFYIWSNVCALNALRRHQGLNVFTLSVKCTENAPAFDQIVCSYLLADAVHHALVLEKSWIVQYLYLLSRIGVVMSPLAENTLFTSYFSTPFVDFFKRGLNVSLATCDPLHFHPSPDPLISEYGTLAKLHRMTAMDMCEIARNSVIISNFPHETKKSWLGNFFMELGSHGNDMTKSSLCDFRLQFRHECLLHEQNVLNLLLSVVHNEAKKKNPSLKGDPLVVSKIPQPRHTRMSDLFEQFRKHRRTNSVDRRINFPRIDVLVTKDAHFKEAAEALRNVLYLRTKYRAQKVMDVSVEDAFKGREGDDFNPEIHEYNNYYGVFLFSRIGKPPPWPDFIPAVHKFNEDVVAIRQAVVGNSDLIQLATHRLLLLEHKFLLHLSLNISNESGPAKATEKEFNNRDFFTATKVDTNVHTEAGMNPRTLLDFFVDKATNNGHDVVFEENLSPVTLRELLERLDINVSRITVDELNHLTTANQEIRNIFLSTDNFMQGRYFAELTKKTLDLYQLDSFTFSENRLAINGKSEGEWWGLAHWFDRYGMSSPQNRWMISLPRSYRKLKQGKLVKNFGEMIDNIFKPLWQISLFPASDIKFHYFLTHVSGFDCVDDESKVDMPLSNVFPHDWNSELNPPYNYYIYYYWANIVSLNNFRASRGLCTFTFRPQSGEMGSVDHLIGAFLVANSINHGVTLAKYPVLEYLYYIARVGIAMSPLSNTAGASPYLDNPFPKFFRRGLNVSLATNRPLYFHFTREPLIEEYSIAAKIWKMEFNDLSEIGKNSVINSGFYPAWKAKALGPLHELNSTLGNDVRKSHVSDIRVAFRYETYHTELNFLDEQLGAGLVMVRSMKQLDEEVAVCEKITGRKVNLLLDDEDQRDPKRVIAKAKVETEELQKAVSRAKFQLDQMTATNTTLASQIEKMRDRLKADRLVLKGNLGLVSGDRSRPLDDESGEES